MKDEYHIKDIGKEETGITKYPLFDKSFFDKASKRTEKIVTALYMVTDFIKDIEPIKFELRTSGLALLGKTYDISKNNGILFKVNMPELASLVKKTVSYLEIAATLSLISNMNYQVLKNELVALLGNYESKIDNADLDIARILEADNKKGESEQMKTVAPGGSFYKGHLKDIFSPDRVSFKTATINVLNNKLPSQSTDSTERKNKIISILNARGSLTIGEISVDIKNVSEKTIQRDLQSLIDENKVERVGERRWSKYSLKDNKKI